jgi:hypothetical protein
MPMLADTIDGARRRRHPPRAPWPPPRSPRSEGSLPRPQPPRTSTATVGCSSSLARTFLGGAVGPLRVRAATAPDAPAFWSSAVSGSSRPPSPSGRPAAPVPRPTPSTRSAQPVAPSPTTWSIVSCPAAAVTGRRCGCCSPPDGTPVPAGSPPSTSPEALIVGAPDDLRAWLRGLSTTAQITRCAGLRDRPARSLAHRMTVRVLHTTAGAHRVPPSRDRRARRPTGHARRRGRAMAGRLAWDRPRHRGPDPGQLVVWRPAALGGRLRHARRSRADRGVVGQGRASPPQPQRRPPAQPRLAHHRAGSAAR